GVFLSDMLRSTPQPWYQHAAWIVMQVADAIAFMHENNKLHLNLSPSGVLVRNDKDGVPRPVLMDFGYPAENAPHFAEAYSGVSYAAPELIRKQNATKTSDVYGLGMLFYE